MTKPPSCQGCTLYNAPGPVWTEGNPTHAKLIYVGQNPGSEEVSEGRPFVGPSGRVFNHQLAEAGIRRSEIFITNTVKCLTPSNRVPTDQEINSCKHFAEAEINACKADVVVLAGAVAFRTFIGDYSTLSPEYHPRTKKGEPVSIMERMGCVEQKDGRKWIGTLHPAHVMRLPMYKQDAVDHLRKALAVAGVKIHLPVVEVVNDDRFILEYALTAKDSGAFADDVETYQDAYTEEDDYVGADYHMDMCGFSAQRYHAIIVKPEKVHLWQDTFADPAVTQFEHNGEYDRYHLEKICPQLNKRFDTMLATHYLRSHSPKKLKPFTVSKYTYLPYYNRDIERVSRELYCGLDNIATLLAGKQMISELKQWELYDVFMEIGMNILPLLEQQRRKGVRINPRKLLLYTQVMEFKIERCRSLLVDMVGADFNPRSDPQMKDLLYDKWGLPKQYNKDKGVSKLTADVEARKRLRTWINSSPKRKEIYAEAHTFLELSDYLSGEETKLTFLNRVSPDLRIHAYYKAHGTRTFRQSSSPNLQNFPIYDIGMWGGARTGRNSGDPTGLESKDLGSLRSMVIPDHDDDLILSCDFSSMQLFIYAVLWGCKWLLELQQKKEYLYGYFYEQMHQEPFFEPGMPKQKKYKLKNPACGMGIFMQRLKNIKAIPLGYLFGRQPEAIALEYQIPVEEARRGYKWWCAQNPELAKSYSDIDYRMKQKGWFRYPYNMIMSFPDLKLNDAIAAQAQVPEAMITQESMILIDREFKKRGYEHTRIMLSVHDSLSFNIGGGRTNPERVVEVYEEIVGPIMSRSISQLKGMKFDHEADVSAEWDWKAVEYEKWKEENCGSTSRVPSGTIETPA